MMKAILTSILLISFSLSAQAKELLDGEAVASCMRENLPPEFSVEDFMLTTQSANGNEDALSGQFFYTRMDTPATENRSRAMLRVENPAPLRNASILMIESDNYMRDGMYVFLPSVDRVRRINGVIADGQILGTDISYYDFKLLRSAFGDMNAELVGVSRIEDRPSYTIHFTPKVPENTAYQYAMADIDTQTCLPLRIKIYENDRLRKEILSSSEDFIQDGSRWYPREMKVIDTAKKSVTWLRTTRIRTDRALPDRLFNPSTFHHRF